MIITRNTARRLISNPETIKTIPALHSLFEEYRALTAKPKADGCCGGGGGSDLGKIQDIEDKALTAIRRFQPHDLQQLRSVLKDPRLYIYQQNEKGETVLKEL